MHFLTIALGVIITIGLVVWGLIEMGKTWRDYIGYCIALTLIGIWCAMIIVIVLDVAINGGHGTEWTNCASPNSWGWLCDERIIGNKTING